MAERLTTRATELSVQLPSRYGRVYGEHGRTVFALLDEIDIVSAAVITPVLDEATSGRAPRLVIDLSGVGFLDCSGLTLLHRARRRALEQGGRFWLVCAVPRTLRLFRAGQVMELFAPVATPAEISSPAGSPDPVAQG